MKLSKQREAELDRFTRRALTSCVCAVLIGLLIGIVMLRAQQEVIVEERVACFTYTNLEEIEDIKPTPKPEYEVIFVDEEVEALARTVWGEARGCGKTQQAAVVWCVLNRADNWNMSIIEVLSQHGQFTGFRSGNPVTDSITTLVKDVLTRWQIEKQGASANEVMRVLPKDYMWFNGNGESNLFRNEYNDYNHMWDWSLPTPYDD